MNMQGRRKQLNVVAVLEFFRRDKVLGIAKFPKPSSRFEVIQN